MLEEEEAKGCCGAFVINHSDLKDRIPQMIIVEDVGGFVDDRGDLRVKIERIAYYLGVAILVIVAVCVVGYIDLLVSSMIVAFRGGGGFTRAIRAIAWIFGLLVFLELSVAVWFIRRRRS
jgi:hypothetical protein